MQDLKSIGKLETGDILDDKWIVMERIGKGGMGEVFRAHQLNLKRDVAIKVISEEVLESLSEDSDETEVILDRLQREVQTMAQVRHPNILQIYDYGSIRTSNAGESRQREYIVMEYIPGNTFRFTMSEEGFENEIELTEEWLKKYFLPLLDGLEMIHSRGIAHRDMKPENVLMDGDTPKIADFGLARSQRMRAISNSWEIKGTVAYMAPEQFNDFRKTGPAADIYALGKILHEAIEGKIDHKKITPFKSVSLSNPQGAFMEKLDEIIRTATAENKDDRHRDVSALKSEILEALEILSEERQTGGASGLPEKPWFNPVYVWAGVFIAVGLVLAMTLWHLMGNPGMPAQESKPAVRQDSRMKETPDTGTEEGKILSLPLPRNIEGEDGISAVLVPQNTFPAGSDKTRNVSVGPFYFDENPVTFQNYTDFLNQAADKLQVKDGIVRQGENIWLYMGTGDAPYEQIYHEKKRYFLRDSNWADSPVVRVTWLGAEAYAEFYDKRLPTSLEWEYAMEFMAEDENQKNSERKNTGAVLRDFPFFAVANAASMMDRMHEGSSGDRLNSPTEKPEESTAVQREEKDLRFRKVGEWVFVQNENEAPSQPGESPRKLPASNLASVRFPSGNPDLEHTRYVWEAFPDVGFRCVKEVSETIR